MSLRHKTCKAKAAIGSNPTSRAFLPEDEVLAREAVHAIRDGTTLMPTSSMSLASCLRLGEGEIQDRACQMVSAINIVSALMLSGLMGVALEPYNIDDLPESKKTIALVFNWLAAFTTALLIMNTVCTTYILGFLSSESKSTIYRALSRGTGFVYAEFLTFFCCFLILALCALANWIHSSASSAAVVGSTLLGVFILSNVIYGNLFGNMFPVQYLQWVILTHPFSLKRVQAGAKFLGPIMAAEASANFYFDVLSPSEELQQEDTSRPLIDNSEKHSFAVPTADDDLTRELKSFVREALPEILGERLELVVSSMISEELTLARLLMSATGAGGKHFIFQALQLLPVGLRLGECVELANLAHNRSSSMQGEYTSV